jgi:hypothetical protein
MQKIIDLLIRLIIKKKEFVHRERAIEMQSLLYYANVCCIIESELFREYIDFFLISFYAKL